MLLAIKLSQVSIYSWRVVSALDLSAAFRSGVEYRIRTIGLGSNPRGFVQLYGIRTIGLGSNPRGFVQLYGIKTIGLGSNPRGFVQLYRIRTIGLDSNQGVLYNYMG